MLGQRAFIQATASWSTDKDPNKPRAPVGYKFGIRIDNVGSTPARKVRNYVAHKFLPDLMPDAFVFSDAPELVKAGGVVMPKQWYLSAFIPADDYITAQQMNRIKAEETRLYVFGWVKYFDSFPGTPERVTQFCYFVRVTGSPEQPVVFTPHTQHNDAT